MDKKSVKLDDWEREQEQRELLEELISRGIVVPPKQSALKRIATLPLRAFVATVEFIKWIVWGRWVFRRNLLRQTLRMRRIAGIGQTDEFSFVKTEKVGFIGDPHSPSRASEIHQESIGKVVREKLPPPDVDDTGVN